MSGNVIDVSIHNFEQEVLLASQQKTVIVDFWAPWCGPCRTLTPVLEQAVAPYGERAVLAKINVDENPEIAQQFQVMGIPAVKAVQNGQLVSEFSGAQPADVVQAWLKELIPDEVPADDAGVEDLVDPEDYEAAEAKAAALVESEPENIDARIRLAGLLTRRSEIGRAKDLLAQVGDKSEHAERARNIGRAIEMIEQAGTADRAELVQALETNARDHNARFALAGHAWRDADHSEAMQQLLEIVRRDRTYRDRAAHHALLGAFEILGTHSPSVETARQELGMILFA